MPKILAAIDHDASNKSISIKIGGIKSSTIGYNSDVNFTQLIDMLSELLDGDDPIEISTIPVIDDEKANLAVNIVKSVIDGFNAVQVESNPSLAQTSI